MRTSPYTSDLRDSVISYIKSGNSQRCAAKVFNIHYTTINRWWIRYQKEGHCKARPRLGKIAQVTAEALSDYLAENPNATSAEIGKHFNVTGRAILYALERFGYSYKKKRFIMWRRAQKNEKDI